MSDVVVTRHESWAEIGLNRPTRRNAVTDVTSAEILDALRKFKDDAGVKSLLLYGEGAMAWSAAAVIAGFSLGAELDVLIYLTSRHFGLKRFGTIFASIMMAMTAGTATGPLVAGSFFDTYGSYDNYLLMIIPMVVIAALSVGTLGPAPKDWPELPEPRPSH